MTETKRFSGLFPVMLTAFTDDDALDDAGNDALVDFYLDHGARGLFAVCQSSEMFDLTDDERLALARRVVAHTAGRVPVVATATFGGAVAQQADLVRRMADTGVDAVVVLPNQLCSADETEADLRPRLEELLERTDPLPLGLYECPQPYHRVLSPAFAAWAAGTGRFRYLKDTSRDPARLGRKIEAVRGTGLALFNAAPASALASLRLGADGVSPVAANLYPDLFAWLCAHTQDPRADWLQARLTIMEGQVRLKYPQGAKRFVATYAGLPIGVRTRVAEYDWDGYDELNHSPLAAMVDEVRAELGLTP